MGEDRDGRHSLCGPLPPGPGRTLGSCSGRLREGSSPGSAPVEEREEDGGMGGVTEEQLMRCMRCTDFLYDFTLWVSFTDSVFAMATSVHARLLLKCGQSCHGDENIDTGSELLYRRSGFHSSTRPLPSTAVAVLHANIKLTSACTSLCRRLGESQKTKVYCKRMSNGGF